MTLEELLPGDATARTALCFVLAVRGDLEWPYPEPPEVTLLRLVESQPGLATLLRLGAMNVPRTIAVAASKSEIH